MTMATISRPNASAIKLSVLSRAVMSCKHLRERCHGIYDYHGHDFRADPLLFERLLPSPA
jgi:hypothetical protein